MSDEMHSKNTAPEQKLLQATNPDPASKAKTPQDQPANTPAPAGTRALPIAHLRAAPLNARKYHNMAAHDRLIADIKANGLLHPIIARQVDGAYEVLAGSRRYRACKQLGWATIPATIISVDDKQAQIISLTENLNRDNLSLYERILGIIHFIILELASAPGWKALIDKHKTDLAAASWILRRAAISHPEPDSKASEALRIPPEALQVILKKVFGALVEMNVKTFADNHLRLLKLPADLREALDDGKIDHTSALELHRLRVPAIRAEHLAAAINEKLTVKELKARVTIALDSTPTKLTLLQTARKQLNGNWRHHKHLTNDQRTDVARRLDELAQILAAARPHTPTETNAE